VILWVDGIADFNALHSALGLQAGLDPADVEAMRAGRSPSDKKLGALSTLARNLIEKRGRLDDQDIERFLAASLARTSCSRQSAGNEIADNKLRALQQEIAGERSDASKDSPLCIRADRNSNPMSP
jgi:hypothetical protein